MARKSTKAAKPAPTRKPYRPPSRPAHTRACCICVRVDDECERIVKVYPAEDHGSGFKAYCAALRDAPKYGSASEVTVDLYPPRSRGVRFIGP